MSDPKLKLIKFSADYCAPCKDMERKKTLEKFAEKHPNVTVIKHSIANAEGNSPKGSSYAEAFALSDVYGANALPTLIFEDEGGGEVARVEGGVGPRDLEALYVRALDRLKLRAGGKVNPNAAGAEEDEDDENEEDGDEENEASH